MPSIIPRPKKSNISDARSTGDSFSSLGLPLESSPSELEEAVRALRQRPTHDLRRAQKHHRRALKALRDDAYEALPKQTRERLIQRFQTNLTALNEALEAKQSEAHESSSQSRSSFFQKALTWLW